MVTIGDHTYSDGDITVEGDMSNVTIGKYCSIGKNLVIDAGFQHRTGWVSTYPFFNRFGVGQPNAFSKGDVNIGNDVWIGRNVTIMSGVTIGDGAVIGAGSIVTSDVGTYCVYAGVPAKVIKLRFTPFQISQLISIKWWDWPHEKVLNEVEGLTSDNIVEFIKKHGQYCDFRIKYDSLK
jgi:acetyltransferase-like isoleucine patch superfamily enzyme